jgi:hypothetical protein
MINASDAVDIVPHRSEAVEVHEIDDDIDF